MMAGCNSNDGGSIVENQTNSGTQADSGTQANDTADVPDYLNMDSALPIVNDSTEITLKVMVKLGAYYEDMNELTDIYFVNAYEEKTNVKIEWIGVSKDAFDDRLALMLATGDLPDVILKSGISNSTQLKYGDQGYFLDLLENDLLETYAPNYWALCTEYPTILTASMMPDGEVYSLGLVRNSVGSTVSSKLYFNQDWLDAVGLSVPVASSELHDVLYAFKNNDPNGNGTKDEIGLYLSTSHLEMTTLGMFGLGNRGMCNDYFDCDTTTGEVRYFPIADEYREWLEYVIELYDTGLLNKEYLDFTESKLGTYVLNDVCGAFGYTNLSMLNEDYQAKMAYLDGALTGSAGANDWFGTNSVGSSGAYIITTACKYPEVALRWADYFYSDEGALFYYYGDEGVTYVENEDGTYSYSDNVLADFYAGTNSFDGCSAYVSLYAYGYSPTKTQVPFNAADDNNGRSLLSAYALIEDCAIAWPSFTFTRTEEKIIEDIRSEISSYVKSSRDAWIMGTVELNDETWNAFVDKIKSMGIDEVLEVYNAALERIHKAGFEEGYHTAAEFE